MGVDNNDKARNGTEMTTPLYFKYWGKAKAVEGEGLAYHLLPYHCLDVVAVAGLWWNCNSCLRRQFTQSMKLQNQQEAKAWIMFFVGLHDLGKLDIRFQLKARDVAVQLQPDIPQNIRRVNTEYYHGEAGYAWFLHEAAAYGFDFRVEDQAQEWVAEVAGHHGVIPCARQEKDKIAGVSPLLIERDKQARIAWINALQQLFRVDFATVPEDIPSMLAGFCSVCDWVGSSDHFPYESNPDIDLEQYLTSRRPNAEQALKEFGILSCLKSNKTLETLFPGYRPRGLQTLTEQLPSVQNFTLIEAPTGSGKTETALVYAARLLNQGLADSIIFALPTQATANAMLNRLEAFAEQLFNEGGNVVLAHGKSALKTSMKKILEHDGQTVQGREEATRQAVRWLTASKKRAFLGQIGVCTIDQVLLSVLPVRHHFVRGFGIRKSVLIVDEVHAYDSYMYGLLERVLELQYQAGGSILLLSATLPQLQRDDLAASWRAKLEKTQIYPLITQVYSDQATAAFTIKDAGQLPEPRDVLLQTWALPAMQFDESSREKIVDAAKKGAKVAVICNLVADAQALAEQLRNQTDVEVDLFHSRFRFKDRQQLEERIKRLYGKDESQRARGGRILVATQVVEQSLDLDFDWLITQLCPVDLLFQRMGRLHRHVRVRPEGFKRTCCVVVVPAEDGQYGDSQYVYSNLRAMWRTWQLLKRNQRVVFHGHDSGQPEPYRDWVEKVYQHEPWPDEPDAMTQAHDKYVDEVQKVAKMAANLMIKQKAESLSDEGDKAAMLTRDGEMSLTILPVTEYNGRTYTLEDEPVDCEDKGYWELVSLNSVGVPSTWRSLFSDCNVKDGVIYLLMLQYGESVWQASAGKETLLYNDISGLIRQRQ